MSYMIVYAPQFSQGNESARVADWRISRETNVSHGFVEVLLGYAAIR